MKISKLLTICFWIICTFSCIVKKRSAVQNLSMDPFKGGKLIFQTGFEGSTQIKRGIVPPGSISHYAIDDVVGKDTTLNGKSDFTADLDDNANAGKFMIEYTGGDSTQRRASIVGEPGNPKNRVLEFWLKEPWEASEHQTKARIQADIYQIKDGFREFYQSERVFLSEDFNLLKAYPEKINWLTISEFWNNEWWVNTEKYGFRVTLGIGKPAGNSDALYFILNAENAGQKEVWHANMSTVRVPVGQWFTMKYYFKEGDKEHGKFYMTIIPDGGVAQAVFNVTNFTHNTYDTRPNGLTGYNPMKLYTSKEVVNYVKGQGKVLRVYWDDFKLWKVK